MTQRLDPWIVLSERGEWRGADEVASRVLDELHRRGNGESEHSQPMANMKPLALSSPSRRRPYLPGPVVAAVAFVAVALTMTATFLIVGVGSRPSPGTSAPTATAPTSSMPNTSASETTVTVPQVPEQLIPATFVSIGEWPSPALAPVLVLDGCPTQPGAPAWFIPDSFFEFLGLDRQALSLTAVDPVSVAATTPILRAGSASIVPLDDLDGGCILAVAGGDAAGWAVYLSDGEPSMLALSIPKPDEFDWDTVSTTPGEYQQWRIATGQHFNGTVSDGGQVHAVTNERLYIATFDPGLLPGTGRTGGWLMSSLAIDPTEATELVESIETDRIMTTALPAVLPPGFGICAVTQAFFLEDQIDGPAEANEQLILCDATGVEITITAGTLPTPPSDAQELDINGHTVTAWPTTEVQTLQFSRSGLDVRIQAPHSIEQDDLVAITASMPLASPPPPDVIDAVALIGVAVGIDPGVTELRDPEGDLDERTLAEWIASIHRGESSVALSDSMQAIHDTALSGLDATPYSYTYQKLDDVTIERASFDVPSLNAWLSIGQQTLPPEQYQGIPFTYVEETWGVWQATTIPTDNHIQIIAYSPSIGLMVNVIITNGLYEEPFSVTTDQAQQVARDILDAIAKPR